MNVATLDLRAASRARAFALPVRAELRAVAQATWRARMVNEHGSAQVFAGLAAQLSLAGLEADAGLCLRFAEEEREHGVLCGAVVESLGGAAIGRALPHRAMPAHEGLPPLEGALCNVLSVACLAETVAVALIGAERLEMPAGPLRELLTRIYADEVGHARFGWRFAARWIPSLEARARARLGDYLGLAFAALEAHELAHLPTSSRPPADGATVGWCDGTDARALFYDAVETIIVPRLDALGVLATQAWASRAASAHPATTET